ncbi:COG4223 family protein [Bartonella heixiaziensis]|uniref:COG4223 family protein n=1 Tax=Bartonella heixiaziensis TaxID=1461000 RepID=UPI0039088E16
MADSSKSKIKSHYTGVRRKKPVIEHEGVSHDSEQKVQNSVELNAIEKQSEQNTQNKRLSGISWFFLPISGIIGGLIALGLAMALQWAGLLPSFSVDDRAGGEKALQIAETAKSQSEETVQKLGRVLQEIDALKAELSSFSSQKLDTFQGEEISQEESRKAVAALEEKVSGLEEYVLNLVSVSKEMKTALSVGESNANDLTALKQQLENMQEEIIAKNNEKEKINTALFIAISSLKNAIDRGGSYVNELTILQQLSPSIEGFDLLQKTATTGLPRSAQLSADFARVADAIVSTQNSVASNAGFFEKILAWIKGLVVSRPIGNVEGTTLGAIAARMEVAIQTGDYDKALSEWQTLPQSAKDVSEDFVHQLERYIAVHHLLQKLLLSAQQGSVKATKM